MDEKAKILDIAMNLNRVGNWAADDFEAKKNRIEMFLNQTNHYISSLDVLSLPDSFRETFKKFLKDFEKLEKEVKVGPKDTLYWAEKMMTWGNILTHRSRLF